MSGEPASEADTVEAARLGDREAFARLVTLHWERLHRWLTRLTHDSNRADDLAQETFAKAFVAMKRFRQGSHFRAWLFRIAHNNWVNGRRSSRHVQFPDGLDGVGNAPDPSVGVEGREAVEKVYAEIRKLPTDFRAALLLRAEEGLSFKEIAEIVRTTEETARWRVFKARQKLLAALEESPLPAEPGAQ